MTKKQTAPKVATTETAQDKLGAVEAAEIIKAEQESRRQRCGQKIQEILEEEGCKIEPMFTITTQGIVPRIDIVPVR